MTFWDGVLTLLYILVFPLISYFSARNKPQQFSREESEERINAYRTTIFSQFILGTALIVLWIFQDRSWESLGLGLYLGIGFWISAGVAAAILLYFYRQVRQVSSGNADVIRKNRDEMGNMLNLMPHSQHELHYFYGVSLTAGVIEELLFRGYFIWFFVQLMPVWGAAIFGILIFGLAHCYQGVKHLPMILLYGAILMGLFILSGSLWVPIALHFFGDVLQGQLAYQIVVQSGLALTENEVE
ncbi:MAG: CPBP family intramembrane glutamic endopeptidase [Calditrichia bacterium]